jgi:hypothetical protein
MELVLFWLAFAAIVAVGANTRGRNPVGWFFLAAVISPLLAGLLLLAMPRRNDSLAIDTAGTMQCPRCAETIRDEALVCRFCGYEIPPAPPGFARLKGIPYRREPDGTVTALIVDTKHRFNSWSSFWNTVHGR